MNRVNIVPGFIPVLSELLSGWRDYHPQIAQRIAAGKLQVLPARQAIQADLLIIHHPQIFSKPPAVLVPISASKAVLVLHHPPFDGYGQANYDLAGTVENIGQAFAVEVVLAPVGPVVRDQLNNISQLNTDILVEDWVNLIDLEKWQQRQQEPQNALIVVGRHSRAQLSKWPDTLEQALLAYPENAPFEIQMRGADHRLGTQYGRVPENWRLLPFQQGGVRSFLIGLDFYVYFHGSQWVEAFGYAILEAMACGVPVILPPHFARQFGDAALYCQLDQVKGVMLDLDADEPARISQTAKARAYVQAHFGLDQFPARLDRLFAGWRLSKQNRSEKMAAKLKRKKRVVMFTSNGTGLGHLTRLLAIANRFSDATDTAFLTLSRAFPLVQQQGYLTQYLPFHQVAGSDQTRWNAALAEEVKDFLQFYQPDTLVFDGNVPYSGLLQALDHMPQIKRIWVRRALWSPRNDPALKRQAAFDAIVEPGEISERFDTGPTAEHRGSVLATDPMLLLQPQKRLSRSEARRELGVSDHVIAVGLMLGAGTNFDFSSVRQAVQNALQTRPDTQVIEFSMPLNRGIETKLPTNNTVVQAYPAFRLSAGFDFMITSAGYNSFHESILGGIPTIFIPNEAPEMDQQRLRARHAQQSGWSEVLRLGDRIIVDQVVSRLFDKDIRQTMRARMGRLQRTDGAQQAADFIERFTSYLRCADPD